MTDIIRGEQKEDTAYFCPACHNPVEFTRPVLSLASTKTPVKCSACEWWGDSTQLAQSSFKHEFKSDDEIAHEMMVDLRNLIAKTAATTYGSLLLKWGFLDQPVQAAQLGRYLMDIAKAVTTQIIATRKALVEEKTRERIGR